jgi:hypothetical protein
VPPASSGRKWQEQQGRTAVAMPDLPRPQEPWRLYKGEAMTEYTFFVPPPPVGWWVLPGGGPSAQIKFSAHKKPRWLTIKMMWWIFEWKYEKA